MAETEDKTVDQSQYPERPLAEAKADPEDIKAVENRPEKDQIEDYHETHPTLKVEAPEAESEVGPVVEQDTPDFTGEQDVEDDEG